MKALKSCLLWLALYAAIAYAIRFAVERRIGIPQPALAAGLILGLFAWMGVGYLVKVAQKFGELWLIWRAVNGAEPVDGARFVAIGAINPSGRTLTSPITRAPAVAYSYTIMNASGGRWSGVAMTPCTIRVGAQQIKLLAEPELDFAEERFSGDPTHIADYIKTTKFESKAQPIVSHDGSFRRDVGTSNQTSSLRRGLITEKIVKPGEEVCVFGRYSAERNAIVADDKARIIKGEASMLIAARAWGMTSSLVGGAITLGIVAALLTALYAIVPLDVVPRPTWEEIRLEGMLDEKVRPHLANYASILPSIESPLQAGEARGRVGDRSLTSARVEENNVMLFAGDDLVLTLTFSESRQLLRSNPPVPPSTVTPGKVNWPAGRVYAIWK